MPDTSFNKKLLVSIEVEAVRGLDWFTEVWLSRTVAAAIGMHVLPIGQVSVNIEKHTCPQPEHYVSSPPRSSLVHPETRAPEGREGEVIDCEMPEPDLVDHPPHYTAGRFEVIDVIEDWGLGFHLGNATKYIARARHKGRELEDLRKARWYLDREIKRLEKL